MSYIKELAKTFGVSIAVTLGMFTAISTWNGGYGKKVEKTVGKWFTKNDKEEAE